MPYRGDTGRISLITEGNQTIQDGKAAEDMRLRAISAGKDADIASVALGRVVVAVRCGTVVKRVVVGIYNLQIRFVTGEADKWVESRMRILGVISASLGQSVATKNIRNCVLKY